MANRFGRIATILTAVIATLALTAGAAMAAVNLSDVSEIDSANDDMGSTATEWSGATYNADRHVILTVDDELNAYEFALAADGTIDDSITPRVLNLNLGATDFEGVAWMAGETYAFLSEGDGEVIVAQVPAPADASSDIETILYSFPVTGQDWGNLGAEGLATDGTAFYVTREMPATIMKFGLTGNFIASVSISTELADASGIAALDDGTYLVISHESRLVGHYEVDWDTETPTQLSTRSADLFPQLEGIAVADSSNVYLFGEQKQGQTYAHLYAEPTEPPTVWEISDVNCSGSVSVADALHIAHIRAGLVEATPDCGSGDINGDGRLSIADAILISQCAVGLANMGCPIIG